MNRTKALLGKGLRLATISAMVLAAAASATAPKAHEVQKTTLIAGSYEDTWTGVVDLFTDRGWPIDKIDKQSGIITTDWMTMKDNADQFVDCGSAPLANDEATQFQYLVRVKDVDDGTTSVTLNAHFRRIRTFDFRVGVVPCESLGYGERKLGENVQKFVSVAADHRAARAKAKPKPKPPSESGSGSATE